MGRVQRTRIGVDPKAYDRGMRSLDRREVGKLLAVAVPSLAGATLAVALLQGAGVPNASAVYLAAVVATAFVGGTWGAIVAAVASFLLYDFLFVLPLYTFTVSDPGEWLNLLLLLFVGIVVGQLAAIQQIADPGGHVEGAGGACAVPGQPGTCDARVDAGGAAKDRGDPAAGDGDGEGVGRPRSGRWPRTRGG